MFAPFSPLALAASLMLPSLVVSDCECGYVVGDKLYTDLMETDFLHTDTISGHWQPQTYTVPPRLSRGPLGKVASPNQIVLNPLKNKHALSGTGSTGRDAGLQLIVPGGMPKDGFVPMAELATFRNDFLYGSFRARMKLTGVSGTCGSIFWYRNDTHEIDLEFLSHQYSNTSHPINLVLQSPESVRAGFDAVKTGSFILQQLPFSPANDFHEYRFDWSPESVLFYADGGFLAAIRTAIPSDPGRIVFSHWSNGNPLWSAGPPQTDAIMTVSSFKAYFNSSEPARYKNFVKRCAGTRGGNATCPVS